MADDRSGTVGDAEQDRLARRAAERTTRGAEHEAGDDIAMAAPQQLSDRPAHRVADDRHRSEVEHLDEGGDVVGTVGEAERHLRLQAAAVAAVIEGDNIEALGKRVVARDPVEVGGRRPPVEQHDRRCAVRPGQMADKRAPAAGKVDVPAVGQHGGIDAELSAMHVAHRIPPLLKQEQAGSRVIRRSRLVSARL